MSFKLKDLQWGDDVYVLLGAIKRICNHDLIERLAQENDNAALRCIATFTGDGRLYIMNPDIGYFPVELLTLKDIACVKRNGELLFPKAFLSDAERKFLYGLAPILQPSTHIMKVQSFGGITEYIKLIDVKTVSKDRENVDFPVFKTNSMYLGLEPNTEYTLDSLGIILEE